MNKKDRAGNFAQIIKGKFKRSVGKTTGDKELESEGIVDQTIGNVKQVSEKVKDIVQE